MCIFFIVGVFASGWDWVFICVCVCVCVPDSVVQKILSLQFNYVLALQWTVTQTVLITPHTHTHSHTHILSQWFSRSHSSIGMHKNFATLVITMINVFNSIQIKFDQWKHTNVMCTDQSAFFEYYIADFYHNYPANYRSMQ